MTSSFIFIEIFALIRHIGNLGIKRRKSGILARTSTTCWLLSRLFEKLRMLFYLKVVSQSPAKARPWWEKENFAPLGPLNTNFNQEFS